MELWEFGLVEHWMKEATPKAEECFAIRKPDKFFRLNPIHLFDLTSAFFILGIGVALATLCFLLELVYRRVKRHF